jgi:6-pyruvoyltetrahydropterin/6-carboxytetrahydropterin synthase
VYLLTFRTDFAAAHQLRGYRGKCENLHGHNFKVEVTVKGTELDRCGMLVDFVDLKAAVNACLEALDHRNLNDLPYFATAVNPSAENIARFVHDEVAKALPPNAAVDGVTVYETDRCSATYRAS